MMLRMKRKKKDLKWWQLSLIGIGCTIGTGFFLGSSIGIKIGGSSIILILILTGFTTYIVFEALAKMAVEDPQKGSFRIYSKKLLEIGRVLVMDGHIGVLNCLLWAAS